MQAVLCMKVPAASFVKREIENSLKVQLTEDSNKTAVHTLTVSIGMFRMLPGRRKGMRQRTQSE